MKDSEGATHDTFSEYGAKVQAEVWPASGKAQAAESKYHDVLKYAAISASLIHSAIMVGVTGKHIRHECYVYEIPEPEPALSVWRSGCRIDGRA